MNDLAGDLADLCRRSALGDAEAFACLVEATQDELLPLACLLVHDATLAEDCLQECYLVAWRRRHLLAPLRDPAMWLRVVLRQVAANARRHREVRRRRERPLQADAAWAAPEHPDACPPGTLDRLRGCMESLAPTARRLVESHYRDGIALAEIAKEAGRGDSWARMSLLRIRRSLADCLGSRQIGAREEDQP